MIDGRDVCVSPSSWREAAEGAVECLAHDLMGTFPDHKRGRTFFNIVERDAKDEVVQLTQASTLLRSLGMEPIDMGRAALHAVAVGRSTFIIVPCWVAGIANRNLVRMGRDVFLSEDVANEIGRPPAKWRATGNPAFAIIGKRINAHKSCGAAPLPMRILGQIDPASKRSHCFDPCHHLRVCSRIEIPSQSPCHELDHCGLDKGQTGLGEALDIL